MACILTSGRTNDATDTPGRRWEETEYCIDPKSGLLRTLSEAPGIYTVYDYSGGMQFPGRPLARQITVVEAGTTVLQIHLDSIEEANSDPSQFVPTHKMISHGPGAVMVGPFRFLETVQVPSGYSGTVQPVIIHAVLDEKDSSMPRRCRVPTPRSRPAALGIVWRSTYAQRMREGKLPREAFINVNFSSPQ